MQKSGGRDLVSRVFLAIWAMVVVVLMILMFVARGGDELPGGDASLVHGWEATEHAEGAGGAGVLDGISAQTRRPGNAAS